MTWIYPGDSQVVIARRVAWAYRQRLAELAPKHCEQLDTVMRQLGQHWAVPRPIPPDPDTWITATDAANLAGVNIKTIGELRRAGRLTGRRKSPGRWEYQIWEIMNLATRPRRRHRKTPETVETPKRQG